MCAGGSMYRKFITPVYILNIIFQSIFDLLTPAAIAFLGAWLLDRYTDVGGWIYAVFITVGVMIGFFSMIMFIVRATAALEAIEKQNQAKYGKKSNGESDDGNIKTTSEDEKNEQ